MSKRTASQELPTLSTKRRRLESSPNYFLDVAIADTRGIIWGMLETIQTLLALSSTCKALQGEGHARLEYLGWTSWRIATWAIDDADAGQTPRAAFTWLCALKYHLDEARRRGISLRLAWSGHLSAPNDSLRFPPRLIGRMKVCISLPTGGRIEIRSLPSSETKSEMAVWTNTSDPTPRLLVCITLDYRPPNHYTPLWANLNMALYPRTDIRID